MAHVDSHRSFRPITILSFRMDAMMTWYFYRNNALSLGNLSDERYSDHKSSIFMSDYPTLLRVSKLIEENSFVFRAGNIGYHGICVALFACLSLHLFTTTSAHQNRDGLKRKSNHKWLSKGTTSAMFASFIFALHPVHVRETLLLLLLLSFCHQVLSFFRFWK
jgi:hypothetical protein